MYFVSPPSPGQVQCCSLMCIGTRSLRQPRLADDPGRHFRSFIHSSRSHGGCCQNHAEIDLASHRVTLEPLLWRLWSRVRQIIDEAQTPVLYTSVAVCCVAAFVSAGVSPRSVWSNSIFISRSAN